MKSTRVAVSLAVLVLVLALPRLAQADEERREDEKPRITVAIRGGENAALQERPAGGRDDEWRFVCELPCEAVVTPDPIAEHRIVDARAKIVRIDLRGADGERLEVEWRRGSADARRALNIGGAIVGGSGLILFGVALPHLLRPAPSAHECPACVTDRQQTHNAQTYATIGVASMAASGIMFITAALIGRSTLAITHGRENAPRGIPENRQPEWSAPELPKPPPLYARVVMLRF